MDNTFSNCVSRKTAALSKDQIVSLFRMMGFGRCHFRLVYLAYTFADREGFIAACANALAFGPKWNPMWNGGDAYHIWTRGVDDVGFISALIDELSRMYTIDLARIYAFGHSNGGFVAYHLGARLPNRFAAIACHARLSVRSGFVAGPPVSVIHFDGNHDPKEPYSGIPKHGWAGVENGISPPSEETVIIL